MRSEPRQRLDPEPPPTRDRESLRDRLQRLGRRFRSWATGPNRVIALAIAVVSFAALWAVLLGQPRQDLFWLEGGWVFDRQESELIRRDLAAQGIAVEMDAQGRLGVAHEHASEATQIVDDRGLARRTLQEILEPERPSFWDDAETRIKRDLRARAEVIERTLEDLSSIRTAVVRLHRERERPYTAPVKVNGATVWLKTDGSGLPDSTLDHILKIVDGWEDSIDPDNQVTVFVDNQPRVIAGDPSHARRAKSEEIARHWEAELNEHLGRDIPGVRVSVLMNHPLGEAAPEQEESRSEPVLSDVAPNRPLSIREARDDAPARPEKEGSANVLIEVPARYILQRVRATFGDRGVDREETEQIISYTRDMIQSKVKHIIYPESMLGRLDILMLPLPIEGPEPPAPETSRAASTPWWGPAALLAIGAVALVLIAAGGRLPTRRVEPGAPAGPHRPPRLDEDDSPGPADRVRELIRRDPQTAAAVLRRWIGQEADS